MRMLSLPTLAAPRGASCAVTLVSGIFLSAMMPGEPAQAQTCDTVRYFSTNCESLCKPDDPRNASLIQYVQKYYRHTRLRFLVTSCHGQSGFDPDGSAVCIITICGFIQTATPRTTQIPPPDLGRANTPRFKTPAPGLLEGDAGFPQNAPAAVGTPIVPATGGGTGTGGGRTGGSSNIR